MKSVVTLRITMAAFVSLLMTLPIVADEALDLMDQVVAHVGDETITGAEFQRDLRQRVRIQQMRQGKIVEATPNFRLSTLEERVNALVLRMLVENAHIDVAEEEIDAAYARQLRNLPAEDGYEQYLERMGMTDAELRDEIRTTLQMKAYIDRETADITVSEEERKACYLRWQAQKRTLRQRATANFAHIFIRTAPDKATEDTAATARAREAYQKVLDGEAFEDVARAYSDDTETFDRGGIRRESPIEFLPPEVSAALSHLSLGELAEPVASRNGWHVLKLLQVYPAGEASYEEIEAQIDEFLRSEKQTEVLREHIERASRILRIETVPHIALNVPLASNEKEAFTETP